VSRRTGRAPFSRASIWPWPCDFGFSDLAEIPWRDVSDQEPDDDDDHQQLQKSEATRARARSRIHRLDTRAVYAAPGHRLKAGLQLRGGDDVELRLGGRILTGLTGLRALAGAR